MLKGGRVRPRRKERGGMFFFEEHPLVCGKEGERWVSSKLGNACMPVDGLANIERKPPLRLSSRARPP